MSTPPAPARTGGRPLDWNPQLSTPAGHAPADHSPPQLQFDRRVLTFQPDERVIRWLPWSDESFALARSLDRPVLLSVKHSASHWCRQMDRDSYADPDISALLNRSFVCVRVDAEDRPDLGAVFRTVTRLVSGSGEWPLTVALTPDRKPFHAATYVPHEGLFDLPGFRDVVGSLATAWHEQRDEIERRAEHLVASLQVYHEGTSSHDSEVDTLDNAFSTLWYQFEPERGGFGPSGQLPSAPTLMFLLRYWKRTGNEQALEMVEVTLRQLRFGGIYDQIGFGFHHRCADDGWQHPWFHKTVYDQALMAMVYIEAFQATGREEYADTAHELFTYLLCDLVHDNGVFITSERDEDGVHRDHPCYLWTPQEVEHTLGREFGDLFCRVFGIEDGGNYSDPESGEPTGRCIPHLERDLAAVAAEQGLHEATLRRRLQASCTELFIAREERKAPRRDTRIRTAYNGLVIAALARGAAALDEPTYGAAAQKAAEWLLENMQDSRSGLLRCHGGDERQDDAPGLLDDYAFLTWGLIELYQARFEPALLQAAIELSESMLDRFWDDDRATLLLAPVNADDLPYRPLALGDGETPAAVSVATWNLARLSRMTAGEEFESRARAIVESCWAQVSRAPARYGQMLVAHELLAGPSVQVVVAGDSDAPEGEDLIRALRSGYHPALQVLARPDRPLQHPITDLAPFTQFQLSQSDIPTAYVCSGFCCESPTVDVDQMLVHLERTGA